MTITITGVVADRLGDMRWADTTIDHLPADRYRTVQPARIPLDISHGEIVGDVIGLELRDDDRLWATAISDVDEIGDLDGPIYFSPSAEHRGHRDAVLMSLALTFDPATVGQPAVTILAGSPADVVLELRWGRTDREVIEHAVAADRTRRDRNQGIIIHRRTRRAVPEWRNTTVPPGAVEWTHDIRVVR